MYVHHTVQTVVTSESVTKEDPSTGGQSLSSHQCQLNWSVAQWIRVLDRVHPGSSFYRLRISKLGDLAAARKQHCHVRSPAFATFQHIGAKLNAHCPASRYIGASRSTIAGRNMIFSSCEFIVLRHRLDTQFPRIQSLTSYDSRQLTS